MKNISRRVFIKGMAVAAVATAASTVLTGCKMPAGVEEQLPTETNSSTFTFVDPTDSKKTLTITVVGMTKGDGIIAPKNSLAVKYKVVNNLGQDFRLYDNEVSGAGDSSYGTADDNYYGLVSFHKNGETGDTISLTNKTNCISHSNSNWADAIGKGAVVYDTVGFIVPDDTTSVSMKVEFKKMLDKSNKVGKPIEDYTFTFNL